MQNSIEVGWNVKVDSRESKAVVLVDVKQDTGRLGCQRWQQRKQDNCVLRCKTGEKHARVTVDSRKSKTILFVGVKQDRGRMECYS